MRTRKDILTDLISFKKSLNQLNNELSKYPWDVEEPILVITKVDFYNILEKCIKEEITHDELEYWANIIECRDDLDFEEEVLQEIIFELANPEINGKISIEKLKEIIDVLNK